MRHPLYTGSVRLHGEDVEMLYEGVSGFKSRHAMKMRLNKKGMAGASNKADASIVASSAMPMDQMKWMFCTM